MRTSDILVILGALASTSLACASKTRTEAIELPAGPPRNGPESSCKHELGRCGGHTPGDGACGAASDTAKSDAVTPGSAPLNDIVLAAGEFAEINFEMGGNSAIDVVFQAAGGPVEWNVHSHNGDKVVIHAEGKGAEGTVHFAAPGGGHYSYLWKNSSTLPVRLTARLTAQGVVRVQSVHPAP